MSARVSLPTRFMSIVLLWEVTLENACCPLLYLILSVDMFLWGLGDTTTCWYSGSVVAATSLRSKLGSLLPTEKLVE